MQPLSPTEDTIIVGAGPIGLACAISAKKCGIDPLVIDAGAIAQAIYRYPVGMNFFTTPELLEIGGHPFVSGGMKPTREEALKYYRGVARAEGIRVRTFTRLTGARRESDGIHCELETRTGTVVVVCKRLVLATGYFGQPNYMNVPGEELPHVSHYFDEPHRGYGMDIVVVGGKNSAIEAALELFRAGAHVTIVYRRDKFPPSVKYWVRPDIENRIARGEIDARLGATILRVHAIGGFRADFDLFRGMGIHFDPDTTRPQVNPDTLETNVPGIYMIGSIVAGENTSEIFIENGRFDGERVFRC